MPSNQTGIGIIGCGYINDQYLTNISKFSSLKVVSCADLQMERARQRSEKYKIPEAVEVNHLLSNPQVEIVLNLTNPSAHQEVSLAAIKAGKNVYSEKPLAITREEGKLILETAKNAGVTVGCAPDTFLGASMQTCRKLIDEQMIGRPVAATAFMVNHGHEHWHPDPDFYYQIGAGPMLDMGPYYLTAMVNLIGPVTKVSGLVGSAFEQRTITSEPNKGQFINVGVPTHVTGLLEFENGAIGTIITSFDIWASELPRMEIYGTAGVLSMPDPNTFDGPVFLKTPMDSDWQNIQLTHPVGGRGVGPAEMAAAINTNKKSRVDAELAYHVLDIMQAIHESSESGKQVRLTSSCRQPEALPPGLPEGFFQN